MRVQFSASQAVLIPVPTQPVPIHHYLRQPQRLIYALTDASRVDVLGDDCFRLKMRPLHFFMLSLQPTVDLQVKVQPNGQVELKSTACEIRGIEYINQRFQLDLVGELHPEVVQGQIQITGLAELQVQVDLPPPLWFTPQSLLETSGNGLLKSVLLTMKQRLMHHLIQDYAVWAREYHEQMSALSEPPVDWELVPLPPVQAG
jgi:hypothetical protein